MARPKTDKQVLTWLTGPEMDAFNAFMDRERERVGFPISRAMWVRKMIGMAVANDAKKRASERSDAGKQADVAAQVG